MFLNIYQPCTRFWDLLALENQIIFYCINILLIFSFNVNALIPLLGLENIAAIRSHTNVLQRATLNNFNVFTSEKCRQMVISFFTIQSNTIVFQIEQPHWHFSQHREKFLISLHYCLTLLYSGTFITICCLTVCIFFCLFVCGHGHRSESKKKPITVPSTFVF